MPALPDGAKAWLLIDVDGVLNVDVSNSVGKKLGLTRTRVNSIGSGWNYTLQLQRWLGAAVREHPVLAPAWATTWFREVDLWGHPAPISRVAGFPAGLPFVDLGYYVDDPRASKVDGIIEFVGDDPFVWLDDDPHRDDVARLAALPNENLFVHTDPNVGVTQEQFNKAVTWTNSLA